MLVATTAMLTVAGTLSLASSIRAGERGHARETDGAAKASPESFDQGGGSRDETKPSRAWMYEGCHATKSKAERVAAQYRRMGYETRIKYDRVADCYEVWYR
jgi:hypothetical protein